MQTYQAIQKFNLLKPRLVFIQHSRVIEIHSEETKAATEYNKQDHRHMVGGIITKIYKNESRKFKCLDCGMTWIENINSPSIVTQSDIISFYSQSQKCTILK